MTNEQQHDTSSTKGSSSRSQVMVSAVLFLVFLSLCAYRIHAERDPQVWVRCLAALSTVSILSFLYGENRLYRLFEHIFIGAATGYLVFVVWRDSLQGDWWQPLAKQGKWYLIFAPLIASMYYTVYFPKYAWMSRLLIGTLFGLYAGQCFQNFAAQVFPQISSSFLPLWRHGNMTWGQVFNNWVFMITLLAVMIYFFFSIRHERAGIRQSAILGRWLLMIAFGATFGSTVMARFSLFIARMQFLLVDWLHIAR